jgi:hypothetical protein
MGLCCRVCGRVRANEKFSGRGHRDHVCKDCQRMPREKRDRIERLDEFHGFLHQSNISGKNIKRIEVVAHHGDAEVTALAELVRDIGRSFPRKQKRWISMARQRPDLFERALALLGAEFFEDLLVGYGDFDSPLWNILEKR